MYYVIEHTYVGPNPNQAQWVDYDHYIVSTEPELTNRSHEICTEGWCGTTNDYAIYAHGVYDTQEAAEAAIEAKLADRGFRQLDMDPQDWNNSPFGAETVETRKLAAAVERAETARKEYLRLVRQHI